MTEKLQVNPEDANREPEAVSLPRRPLSRRALIKAAGIAPFIALARQAWALPTPRLMAAVADSVPIPAGQLAAATTEAVAVYPTLSVYKFELVARALWGHFHYGLGGVCVSDSLTPTLLMLMFNEPLEKDRTIKTGLKVADNIVAGEFDPFGNDYQTNVCAYICGHKAATGALALKKTEIDEADYKAARTATEREMSDKLAVVCSKAGSPKAAQAPRAKLGFGC